MLSKQVIVLFISFMCVSLHGCGEEKSSDSDPVDCQLSAWEDAKDSSGVCTATCGGGVKTQERTVIQEPAFGGSECGSLKQDIPCNTKACPQWRQMQKSPAQCSPRFRAYLQASRYWTQEMLQAQCEADDDCVGYYWDTELKRGDGCKSVKIDLVWQMRTGTPRISGQILHSIQTRKHWQTSVTTGASVKTVTFLPGPGGPVSPPWPRNRMAID